MGVTGWVRNDLNGTVSMELQGSAAQLDEVLRMLEHANWIRIDEINARDIPVEADERGFVTRDDGW
jgi:acylphosphatase